MNISLTTLCVKTSQDCSRQVKMVTKYIDQYSFVDWSMKLLLVTYASARLLSKNSRFL